MPLRLSARGPAHRRRLATSAVAFLSLGALAVGGVALTDFGGFTSSDAEVELASTATCYDMVSIAVGGRGDSPKNGVTKMLTTPDGTPLPAALAGDFESDWIDQMVGAPNDKVKEGSYAAVYVEYPADMASYDEAVNTGVENSQKVMRAIAASCPNTRFAIVGYSEGADVTRRAAMEIGNQTAGPDGKWGIVDPANVVGVVILADAGRKAGEGAFPGSTSGTGPDGFDTVYQNGSGPAGAGALPGTSGSFGALEGKVASFCSEGDLTCAMPENTSLLHLAANVGRQLDVDSLQRDNLTPATGADLAVVLGRIAVAAFSDIASQDNWLASDETFLDVLLKVSEPGYKPGVATKPVAKVDEEGEPLPASEAVNLAYLPSKIAKEIIGFIGSNANTVQVVMNDPYGQTLGPGSGHHFDYWRDADPAKGKPLTSAQYAAAWLTQLAKDAEAGKPIKTAEVQENARLAVLADPTTATDTTTSAAATTTSVVTAPPAVSAEPTPIAPEIVAPPVDPALSVDPAQPVDASAPVASAQPIEGSTVEETQAEGTVTTTTAVPTTVAPTTTPAP